MTDHLPECPCQDANEPWWDCICPALRACEARVHEAAYQAGKAYGLTVNGYSRGVSAARDAVEVALLGTLQSTRDRVLAAIDALKEDK